MACCCRSIASEVARRLLELVGWLAGRLRLRRMRSFESSYFQLRRWHALLGEVGPGVAELPASLSNIKLAVSGRPALCNRQLTPALMPACAAATVAAKLLRWAVRTWLEMSSGTRQRRKELQRRMQEADSYLEWADAAQEVGCLPEQGRMLFLAAPSSWSPGPQACCDGWPLSARHLPAAARSWTPCATPVHHRGDSWRSASMTAACCRSAQPRGVSIAPACRACTAPTAWGSRVAFHERPAPGLRGSWLRRRAGQFTHLAST